MFSLRWQELFKALFLAGFLSYLAVAISGITWLGIPVLIATGWLFYDFRQKIATFKRVFREELPGEFRRALPFWKDLAKESKKFFWDENQVKILSLVVTPIALFLGLRAFVKFLTIHFPLSGPDALAACAPAVMAIILGFCCWFLLLILVSDKEITYQRMGNFFWQIGLFFWGMPKFLLKTVILTIRQVHSRELVAVSLYSLSGMFYIIAFPPFRLEPSQIFLLALGCGLFTGLVGLAMHKVLSTALAQNFFAKVEAW